MPETQHHNIDFVLIATATTPAAAIQGIKPCHKPASKAPGLIKSLATNAARRAYRNIGKHHRPDRFNDFEHHSVPRPDKLSEPRSTTRQNHRPVATEFTYNCHRIERHRKTHFFRKPL